MDGKQNYAASVQTIIISNALFAQAQSTHDYAL